MDAVMTTTRSEVIRLQLERQETVEKLEHLQTDLRNTAERSADEADVDTYEREKTLALVQSLQRKLASLDHAIRLAQNGTYGVCEGCGGRIDPARLEILPQATLCLKCQREYERKNKWGRR